MNRLLLVIALAAIASPALAQDAVVPVTTVNLGFMGELWTILIGFIMTGVSLLLGWVLNILRVKFNLDIDQRNRDALHSAAKSGVEAAIAKYGPIVSNAQIDVRNPVIAAALQHVLNSVPGALKHFGIGSSSEALQNIVISKAQETAVKPPQTLL